jgi:uncharacterized protein YbjT (DUF2867 family)
MITVFGATGNTGSVVATKLLDAGKKIRVVGRDAAKLAHFKERGADVLEGDVTSPATIARALMGASEGAYLLLPPDVTNDDVLDRNKFMADTYALHMNAQGVKHAVMLSSIGAQHASGNGPIAGNHYCETTMPGTAPKTKFTFLRPGSFMENILNSAGMIKEQGILPVWGGGEGYAFPMVATKDIGAIAAESLLAGPPAANEVIEIMGPKEYSYDDAAAAASEILGKPVKTSVFPMDALVPTYMKFGMSENFAQLMREMTEAAQKGLLVNEPGHKMVRGTTTLADVLRAGLTK